MEGTWNTIITKGGFGCVTFICNDEVKLYVPRLVLKLRSEHITKLLENDTKSGDEPTIIVEQPSDIVKSVLYYICSDIVIIDKSLLNSFKVLILAREWMIDPIIREYEKQFCNIVNESIQLCIFRLANAYNFNEIKSLLLPKIANIILRKNENKIDEKVESQITSLPRGLLVEIMLFIYKNNVQMKNLPVKNKAPPEPSKTDSPFSLTPFALKKAATMPTYPHGMGFGTRFP